MVTIQIVAFLEENNLLSPTIHGYRAEHGCETSVIELIERAVESQEEGSQFGLCLYDQSAVFD